MKLLINESNFENKDFHNALAAYANRWVFDVAAEILMMRNEIFENKLLVNILCEWHKNEQKWEEHRDSIYREMMGNELIGYVNCVEDKKHDYELYHSLYGEKAFRLIEILNDVIFLEANERAEARKN